MLVKEILTEVADSVVHDYRQTSSSSSMFFMAKGTVNGREIAIEVAPDNPKLGSWIFEFSEKVIRPDGRATQTTAPTGSGKAFEVFALVMHAMQEFINERSPNVIEVYAAKDSKKDHANPKDLESTRAVIYSKLLKRKFGNMFEFSTKMSGSGNSVIVVMTRKK